jgi:molybdopterin synthase catalytic subunit
VPRVFVIHRPIVRDEIQFPIDAKSAGSILEYFQVVKNCGAEPIRAMRYEGDRELLRSQLHEVASRIAQHYELTEFECFRRMGEVPAGEPCMLIRLAAQHTDEAFRAMSDFLAAAQKIEISATPVT